MSYSDDPGRLGHKHSFRLKAKKELDRFHTNWPNHYPSSSTLYSEHSAVEQITFSWRPLKTSLFCLHCQIETCDSSLCSTCFHCSRVKWQSTFNNSIQHLALSSVHVQFPCRCLAVRSKYCSSHSVTQHVPPHQYITEY